MPPPAMIHAIIAPNGPVAVPNVLGKEKMPAPIMEPMTIAVSEKSGSFLSVADAGGDAVEAVDNAISSPRSVLYRTISVGSYLGIL
jgi:hypothetical protein